MPVYELDAWVAVVTGRIAPPSPDYIVVMFPNDEVRDAYLSTVTERPEEEIRSILRKFLGDSRTVELTDRLHLDSLKSRHQIVQEGRSSDITSGIPLTEYDRRVVAFFAGASTTPT